METVLWLLLLFVVVAFANVARRNKIIRRQKALEQQQARNQAGSQVPGEDDPKSPL